MTPSEILDLLKLKFEGVESKKAFSETTLFYNPDHKLPNGVYFLTIKEEDGPNDNASKLSRQGIFRVSFKPLPQTYQSHFGDKPSRPAKGEVTEFGHDHSQLDKWMPHSVYAWMGWTMILNPSKKNMESLWPYIEESYAQAKRKFFERTK